MAIEAGIRTHASPLAGESLPSGSDPRVAGAKRRSEGGGAEGTAGVLSGTTPIPNPSPQGGREKGARTTTIAFAETPLLAYVLRRADDALILGHRLSEWCGHGPMLEEDIALANIALDLIGQARSLFDYAATVDGSGLTEDHFAFRRDPPQFRNCLLVEQPNGDFAGTIVRQFLFSAVNDPYWRAMMRSADETLAAIAAKAEKETAYHLRHAAEWLIRLGDGTEESRRRAQDALDDLWIYTNELFEIDAVEQAMLEAGVAVDPASLRPTFDATLDAVLAEATLIRPSGPALQTGGRSGRHTEHLGHLLAEMQILPRTHPEAVW